VAGAGDGCGAGGGGQGGQGGGGGGLLESAAALHKPIHGALVEDRFGEAMQAVAALVVFDGRVGVGGLDGLHETGVIGEKAGTVSCGGMWTRGGTAAP